MRVVIHFERTDGKCILHDKRIVESDFLEEEMDAVEFANKEDPKFSWLPRRPLQIELIKKALPEMYVDPLVFDYGFRRAVIDQKGIENAGRESDGSVL